MLGYYFVVALRGLWRNGLYAAINVLGLAIALAACVLIFLFVRDELSYDTWIPDSDRLYTIYSDWNFPGREPSHSNLTPSRMAPLLLQDFREIEQAVRVLHWSAVIRRGDKLFGEPVQFVDPDFFEMFGLRFLAGKAEGCLGDTSSVVLTERMARKYFGAEDPIGKTLRINGSVQDRDFRVTAVIADPPHNTTLSYGIILRYEESEFEARWSQFASNWGNLNFITYVKLAPGVSAAAVNRRLPLFEQRHIPPWQIGDEIIAAHEHIDFFLHPLVDVHLRSGPYAPGEGDIGATRAMTMVAVFIFLIACINFVNLATVRADGRAMEMALRKVAGAARADLVRQLFGESTLLAALAALVALAMAELALPAYNAFLGRNMTVTWFGEGTVLPYIAGAVLIIGLVAGFYPAVMLSAVRPSRMIGTRRPEGGGSGRLRHFLVVFQFAISIALISATAVVYAQMQFVRTKDLGFDKNGLLVLRNLGYDEAAAVSTRLKGEIENLPGVVSTALSSMVPGDSSFANQFVKRADTPDVRRLLLGRIEIDENFLKTYHIPLIAGRNFDPRFAEDDASGGDGNSRPSTVLINERAVRFLGFASPREAVGKELFLQMDGAANPPVRIIGVIGDFHYKSLHETIRPTFYQMDKNAFGNLTIRFEGVSGRELLENIAALWRAAVPAIPFRADFIDGWINRQYRDEDSQAVMLAAFSGLAIVLSCLGLLGLASFAARRRTFEIALRKVVGARIRDILRLMTAEFTRPVLLANLIAWPVAWYVMRRWLDGFAYRIDLEFWPFLAAGAGALLVALLTVSGHALAAARTHPAIALREE